MIKMKREWIDVFLNVFVESAQAKHGINGGLGYAAGFFQSQLAAVLVDLPAEKQLEVLQIFVQQISEE